MDPLQAEIRQIAFYDTPDLRLNKAGVVVRARRIQGKPADSVVKLRPVDPDDLPASLRKLPGFGVEVDAMPGGFVCSGRLKAEVRSGAGDQGLRQPAMSPKMFTKDQRAFYAKHAPDGIELGDLVMLGPVNIMKLKFTAEALRRKMVAELWLYPDGTRVLELSTKCLPSQAFDTAARPRRSSPSTASTCPPRSRPRRARRSSTSPRICRRDIVSTTIQYQHCDSEPEGPRSTRSPPTRCAASSTSIRPSASPTTRCSSGATATARTSSPRRPRSRAGRRSSASTGT